MKRTIATLLLTVGVTTTLSAQTNSLVLSQTPTDSKSNVIAPITTADISAQEAEFHVRSNLAIFKKNVRVSTPRLNLSCDRLEAKLAQFAGNIESMEATGSVSFDILDPQGRKFKGKAGKVVYKSVITPTLTNEVVELQESPVIETDQGKLTAELIVYNRITGQLNAQNAHMLVTEPEALTQQAPQKTYTNRTDTEAHKSN